jgi:hypothetical protein
MVVLNYSPGKRFPEVLVDIVKDEMRINKHGFSFHAVVGEDDVVLRSLDAKKYLSELKNIMEKSPRLLHVHLRLASAGAVNEENIHMWKIGRYYISHNGSVLQFACDTEPYPYQYLYRSSRLPSCGGVKSDTLQLIESSEFTSALNSIDNKPKELWSVLQKHGLYGVMFMTSEHEVIAISARKPLYIYATKHLLIFVNEPIEIVKPVRRFGFTLSLNTVPYTTFRNGMIRYDLAKMKPLFFRPKLKPKPFKPRYDDYPSFEDWWWEWSK